MSVYVKRFWLVAVVLAVLCLTVGCGEKAPVEKNAVTAVELVGSAITVRAELTDGFIKSADGEVYLFELPSHLGATAELSQLSPVDAAKPARSLSFALPARDGMRERMYSSFLLATKDARGVYTALTAPVAVQDPQAIAENTAASPAQESLKGLVVTDVPAADALHLGVAHAVVDVFLEDIILGAWEPGCETYITNGLTAYLDGEALAALDETVALHTAAGAQVFLRFRLGESDDPLLRGLYLSDPLLSSTVNPGQTGTVRDGEYSVNMARPETARLMEGFFSHMAARYEGVSFILGSRMNTRAEGQTLLSAVSNYEKLVRVAHTALRAHQANGRVYIAPDHRRAVTAEGPGWDVPTYLAAFRDEAALRGDFDWHIAAELYASTPSVWVEDAVAAADDAAHFTVRNLGTLTDLLAGEKYLTPAGEVRRLLIGGMAIPVGTPESDDARTRQAASYAFTYLTARASGRIEAVIYDVYTDPTETPAGGLRQHDGKVRPLYDVFRRIDTTDAEGLHSGMTAIVGDPYAKLTTALAGAGAPVTALTGASSLGTYAPDVKPAKGTATLYSFGGGSTGGFVDAGGLTYLALAESGESEPIHLYAQFEDTAPAPVGISTTLSAGALLEAEKLSLDLYTAAPRSTLTLRLTRPAKGATSAGDGALVYESAVSGITSESHTATFDISSLTALLDEEDEVVMTLLLETPTPSVDSSNGVPAPSLGLYRISVTGAKGNGGAPIGIIIAVVAVLLLAVAGGFAFLYLRNRKANRR